MQVVCPRCGRILEYTTEPPTFCSFCGQHLADALTQEHRQSLSHAETQPPAAPVAPATVARPDAIGGYRLLRTLGSGGMGAVYEAEEAHTGRRVALKLMSPEFAGSTESLARFRQEGRLASILAHPRCVFVYAAEEEDGRPYLVMELMPGTTLQDVISHQGPSPVADAVAKILDVIDGLEAAHERGIIHRDVKPSNCFVDTDGRVKIGDFGLCKSLLQAQHLTRTGTFLGTPLYSSPEQVRGSRLDVRTDVYSVGATLYCLLTGQAPFQGSDAAATLARIVADPAPSLRSLRPELPPELDKVVLRALERNRERRYGSLTEFREALLPFLPQHHSIGSLGLRSCAYLLDFALVWGAWGTIQLALPELRQSVAFTFGQLWWAAYFVLLEGYWGCTLGKRLFRLRVHRAQESRVPALGWAALRACCFALFWFPADLGEFIPDSQEAGIRPLAGASVLGLVLVVCTMRRRNGYRGLHEFLSRTRVLQVPERDRRRPVQQCSSLPTILEKGPRIDLPERVGPYTVRDVVSASEHDQVLLGEDASLGRPIWLWLRPQQEPALSETRRALSRPTRLRWLNAGEEGARRWDAFLAPIGWPLVTVVQPEQPLAWRETRWLLEQLAEELTAAKTDGTLPGHLSTERVWVDAHARAQVIDLPLAAGPLATTKVAASDPDLELLWQTTTLALEGRCRDQTTAATPVRAPLPLYAAQTLKRLAPPSKLVDVKQFHSELTSLVRQPAELSRQRRAAHLVLLMGLLLPGMLFMFLLTWGMNDRPVGRLASDLIATQALLQVLEDKPLRTDFLAHLEEPVRDWDARRAAIQTRLAWDREQYRAHAAGLRFNLLTTLITVDEQAEIRAAKRLIENESLELHRVPDEQTFRVEFIAADLESTALPDALNTLASVLAHPERRIYEQSSVRWGEEYWGYMLLLGAFPLIWIIWSFFFRGGLAFWMLGIALVRGDGRRAGRWQCAWRACLVWLPIVLLLGLSNSLELWSWTGHVAGRALVHLVWEAAGLWWAAAALLIVYLVVAFRSPMRGWHDRLAGTYLVPC
jgi:uncharacterized RDD family membrane protein YckC